MDLAVLVVVLLVVSRTRVSVKSRRVVTRPLISGETAARVPHDQFARGTAAY